MLIDGEWSKDENTGGYALKLGNHFLGTIRQRGGDGIYSECWTISLNGQHVQEVGRDPDYAKGFVERLICDELHRIVPAFKLIQQRVPPADCFWGQDSDIHWKNWKEDRAVEGWVFVRPTLRQIHEAMKRKP